MAQESRKSELIQSLAQSRTRVSTATSVLRRDFDFKTRFKRSYDKHTSLWLLGGGGLLGTLLAGILRPRKKVVVHAEKIKGVKGGLQKSILESGMLLSILKVAFNLLRPMITVWITKRVASHTAKTTSTRPGR